NSAYARVPVQTTLSIALDQSTRRKRGPGGALTNLMISSDVFSAVFSFMVLFSSFQRIALAPSRLSQSSRLRNSSAHTPAFSETFRFPCASASVASYYPREIVQR